MTFKMINVRLLKHKHNLTSTSQNRIIPKIRTLSTSKHTYTHNQNQKQKKPIDPLLKNLKNIKISKRKRTY